MSGSETAVVETRVAVLETEEARNLLEAGREAGSLSADEITLALDELGHRAPLADCLALELGHDGIVDVEGGLHMGNHTVSMAVGQAHTRQISRVSCGSSSCAARSSWVIWSEAPAKRTMM